ncbi:MAG: hypothetical protein H0U76_25690 [Ktedonobacteraceae bacterium]|nr:hypothetical protein [Ktedonobacteraceae bacterium]
MSTIWSVRFDALKGRGQKAAEYAIKIDSAILLRQSRWWPKRRTMSDLGQHVTPLRLQAGLRAVNWRLCFAKDLEGG